MSRIIQLLFLLIYLSLISRSSVLGLRCYEYHPFNRSTPNETIEIDYKIAGLPYHEYIKLAEKDCLENEYCITIWKNENGTDYPAVVGCYDKLGEDCDSETCVNHRAVSHGEELWFTCCCNADACNFDFKHVPRTTIPPSTTPPTKPEDNNTLPFYLVYVAFPASLIIMLIVMFVLKKKKPFFSQIPSMDQNSQSLPSTPPNEKLRPIKLEETIARGKYGAVWRAAYKNEVVAVKIMPAQEKEPWLTEQEVFKLAHMTHDNIVGFVGAEKRGDSLHAEYWIITAYHPMGSLHDYLKTHTITWEQFLRLGFTIARGLMHLHEEIMPIKGDDYKPSIAHRDFKSSNILLKDDLTACIADFDLALIFKPNRACGDTHGQVGTRRYMAPEVLEGAINFSSDSFLRIDTYAFGLVLWEIASRCSSFYKGPVPPYKLPFEAEIGVHPTLEDMQEIVVQQKRRPIINKDWSEHDGFVALSSCIEECWDHDPEARISASCVMERFLEYIRFNGSPDTPLLLCNDTMTSVTTNSINHELTNGYLVV